MIETPGRSGKFKGRVIGIIRFSDCKKYKSAADFYDDSELHLIEVGAKDYAWSNGVLKFGWVVESVKKVNEFDAPSPRGIIYCRPFDKQLRY